MSGQRVIALLGRPDAPTDAVEEYCRYLGEAMTAEGFELIIERVAWPQDGWTRAAKGLRRRAKRWRGAWVLVQYTALAWSARGFPLRFPRLLSILKAAQVRVGVVFHDVEPYGGTRAIDRLRRRAQLHAMLKALRVCDAAIFTVPMEKISWLKNQLGKGCFIPVGANLPTASKANSRKGILTRGKLSVAVFGITGGEAGRGEIDQIVDAVQFAASRVGNLRLIVFGRNAQRAEAELRQRFQDGGVELHVMGVLPGEDVVRSLAVCARTYFHAARQRNRWDCLRPAGGRVRWIGNGGADHRSGTGTLFPAEEGRPGRRPAPRFGGRALSRFACTAKLGGTAAVFFMARDCGALRGIHAEFEIGSAFCK